jgi:hypothetical protein
MPARSATIGTAVPAKVSSVNTSRAASSSDSRVDSALADWGLSRPGAPMPIIVPRPIAGPATSLRRGTGG